MEGKRLLLESPERLGISTVVSVEYNDALFLGDVMNCRGASDGVWLVEIKVQQILTGLQSLMALRAGLLGDGVPAPRGFVPAGGLN
jgi:hypothetical protein